MSGPVKVRLINRRHCKEFALEMAKGRAHRFTRVSGDFLLTCEGQPVHPQPRSSPPLQGQDHQIKPINPGRYFTGHYSKESS